MRKIWFMLSLVLVACQGKPQVETQRLRINLPFEPTTLDLRKAGDMVSVSVHFLIFEGLTRLTPDGPTELALAHQIDLSEDRKTYTFHLRDSFWSDGTPLTAADFVYSWQSMLEPDFPCMTAHLLYPIKNALTIKQGSLPAEALGVVAKDEKTLVVHLEKPTPYFLELTAFAALRPVPKHKASVSSDWADRSNIVSNGPFIVESRRLHDGLILKKNPHYWEGDAVRLQEVVISTIEDPITALRLYEKGGLDVMGSPYTSIPDDALKKLQDMQQLATHPTTATTACTFNIQHGLLQNQKIRQAISGAIDRESIVTNITELGEEPAYQIVHPALASWNLFPNSIQDSPRQLFDKGLDELGLALDEVKPVTLLFSMSDRNHKIAQAIQQQLVNTLGLSIHLEAAETKVYFDRLTRQQYDMALFVMRAYYHDPLSILERFEYLDSPKNYPQWENSEYISLLEDQGYADDEQTRASMLQKAEQIIMDEMPITPIFHWTFAFMQQPNIKNIYISSRGSINPQWAYVDQKDSF